MTIERPLSAEPAPVEEMVQFLFSAASAGALLQGARALLDTAPKELAESFEQAVRAAGLVS
jgi:hypothetical protein